MLDGFLCKLFRLLYTFSMSSHIIMFLNVFKIICRSWSNIQNGEQATILQASQILRRRPLPCRRITNRHSAAILRLSPDMEDRSAHTLVRQGGLEMDDAYLSDTYLSDAYTAIPLYVKAASGFSQVKVDITCVSRPTGRILSLQKQLA